MSLNGARCRCVWLVPFSNHNWNAERRSAWKTTSWASHVPSLVHRTFDQMSPRQPATTIQKNYLFSCDLFETFVDNISWLVFGVFGARNGHRTNANTIAYWRCCNVKLSDKSPFRLHNESMHSMEHSPLPLSLPVHAALSSASSSSSCVSFREY